MTQLTDRETVRRATALPSLDVRIEEVQQIAPSTGHDLGCWREGGGQLASPSRSRRVVVRSAGGDVLASGSVTKGESSKFRKLARVQEADVERVVVLSDIEAAPNASREVLGVLVYALLRRGRIWGRHNVVAYADREHSGRLGECLGWEPLTKLPGARNNGLDYAPVWQRLDLAIHRAYNQAGAGGQNDVHALFVDEAVEVLDAHLDRLYETGFFRAIQEGRITREQYIWAMSNLHQFVRWTTRLIGRAVSLSNNEEVRNHWLGHLSGEINHEKIIEKDLANLGADVNYVRNEMVPSVPTHQFMVTQESAVAFQQDPVLFMAAPFAAEAISARLDKRFMDGLETAAAGWGIANPKHVTNFLASHIHYDGGDDGHWEHTRDMLLRHLRTDEQLQRFLNIARLAMGAFELAYDGYVEDLRICSAKPADDARAFTETAQA